MNREEKLLNLIMNQASSDGEIINAINILKRKNIKLSINNSKQEYDTLLIKYNSLLKNNTKLKDDYSLLCNRHNNLIRRYNQLQDSYEDNLKDNIKLFNQYEKQIKNTEGWIMILTISIFVLILIIIYQLIR